MASSGEAFEFNGIFQEHMGALQDGYLKLQRQNVLFKNASTGRLLTVPLEEVDGVYWQKLGNKPGLKLVTRDGAHYRFGGFKESDFSKISTFSQSKWNQPVAKQDLCLKGWNYGEVKFEGRNLEFDVDGKPAFEIPLSNVSHCTGTKTEAILEFHVNEDCPVQLSEMRLHIPPNPEEADKEEGQAYDPVEEFKKAVMQFAEVETEAGQPLCTLQEILLATPRGRYEIKVFANQLALRGKTYNYNIPMKQVQRMFLLPHKDGRQMYFAININPPIRQGLTKYPFIVIECSKDDEIELELGGELSPEQLKEKYNGKLEPHMKGLLYEVMAKLFRTLVNQRITIPGNFTGSSGTPAISCALRQSAGYLYPLEKGFVFVHKPPQYLRFDEIDSVNFARSDVSTRSFDFELTLKNGQVVVFASVGKEEYSKLFDYVRNKRLKIRNAARMDKPVYKEDRFADSDGEDVDHYKEGLKADARQRKARGGDEEESDEDEEDEDYDMEADVRKQKKAREEESSSADGSGSEPDEEYESGTTDDSMAGAASSSKKKEKSKSSSSKDKSSKKSSGKEKDSDAPKRPQTAFFIWQRENRESIKKPGDSVTETATRAGAMWKKLSDDEKRPYEKKAVEDKQRYEREMAAYNAKGKGGSASTKAGGPTVSPSKKPPTSKEFIDDSDAEFDSDLSSDDDDGGGGGAKKPSTSKKSRGEPPSKKAKDVGKAGPSASKSKNKGKKGDSSGEEEEEIEKSDAGTTPATSDDDD